MKWMVKINRDENGDITSRDILYRTDETAKPRGGEFELVEGVETGYPLIDVQVVNGKDVVTVVEDTAKKDLEESIALKVVRMDFGKRVIALLSVRNDAKSLTPAQIQQLPVTYGDARNALQDGSISTARAIIDAIVPDGTIVTADDKTAILAEIDANLTQLGY